MGLQWMAWDDQARQEAFQSQRLIMVYCASALDYWSHQWLREIEGHAELSAVIPEVCIPVKIIVDEEPELAARVQEVLAVASGSASWPAIAWFTPQGNPLGATPYRPILDGAQMRGFAPMFIEIIEAWSANRDALEADVEDMRAAWRHPLHLIAESHEKPKDIAKDFHKAADLLEAHLMHHADTLEGGFGEAPRPLSPEWLLFLLQRVEQQKAAPSLRAHIEKTLNAMIAGGIHDHLQGGFFRASTDASWNIPFFEKRCADQARMIPVFIKASQVLEHEVYADIALRCLQFIIDYCKRDDGLCAFGFAAESQGAGAQPINGAAYLWSYQGIEDVIGSHGAGIINKRFLSDQRCFVDDDFAQFAIRDELTDKEREELPALCHRLMAARLEWPQPQRDERIVPLVQTLVLQAVDDCIQHKIGDQELLQNWSQQLQQYVLECEYDNVIDHAQAVLAIHSLHNADHVAWIDRQLHALKQYLFENAVLLETEGVFADQVIAASDSPDYTSPIAALYAILHKEDESLAENLLHAYAGIVHAAPMAHASIIHAYFVINHA